MTRYLLAADADKIQDLVFRSARLRQVFGGSRLLATFCTEIEQLVGLRDDEPPDYRKIINAGGSFRLSFADQEQAMLFKTDLAAAYHWATGGTLTVVGPEEYADDEAFGLANQRLQHKLQAAKSDSRGPAAGEHISLMALCASCGRDWAVTYGTLPGEPEDAPDQAPRYLCRPCWEKAQVREAGRDLFLDTFRRAIEQRHSHLNSQQMPAPRDPAGHVAQFDPTGYVAYIMADGNNMGAHFRTCQSETDLKTMSDRLEAAAWASLAEPAANLLELMDRYPQVRPHHHPDDLPLVPLIAGGDDLFCLAPARYALDIARLLCQTFQAEMATIAPVTITAAVVICKQNYPYKLAHDVAEKSLETAKQAVKSLDAPVSAVTFQVITGNSPTAEEPESLYRSTLRPYWVWPPQLALNGHLAGVNNAGVSLQALVEQRYALRNLPHKRLVELRQLFGPRLTELGSDNIPSWTGEMDTFLARVRQVRRADWPALKGALTALGAEPTRRGGFVWRTVTRPGEDAFSAHGLPDLIAMWDYAFDLRRNPADYEAEVQ